MPRIRPETDLRDSYQEISAYCRDKKEPVFITRQGHGDLVVMSLEVYELLVQSMDIYRLDRLLNEGRVTEVGSVMQRLNTAESGSRGFTLQTDDVKKNIREFTPSRNQEDESRMGSEDGTFSFRSAAAQNRSDAPVQKSRQEFVKPE
ncbi:MAG: type II toxin-antitoxin system Phd/YefM family antitoxin [Peptococcaceae bacterium]|nr:type II toxin-antitoxin system Phd/YefM family antitoxin [Peptococcaceae bacterium]